jgi:hypothetical protein
MQGEAFTSMLEAQDRRDVVTLQVISAAWVSRALLLLVVVYPICYVWQGLDVTDTGYALANCQQFFHAYPKDLDDPYLTNRWLSHLLGGGWYKLTGGCGVLGFRILYVLLLYGTLAMVYCAVRGAATTKVFLALLAATAFCVSKSLYVPTYNEFTALLFVVSAVALHYGVVCSRKALIFLAGLSGGVALFARFPPNVMVVALVLGIWFYRALATSGWREFFGGPWRRALRESLVFTVGYAIGAAGVLLLVVAVGHLGAFVKMWYVLSAMVKDPADAYSGAGLLRLFLHDHFYAGVALVCSMGCGIGLAIVGRYARGRAARAVLVALPAVLLAVFLLEFPNWSIYFFPGALYAVLLSGTFGGLRLGREARLLCLLAALVLFITPLGSNNGIFNASYGSHLAVALAFLVLTGGLERMQSSGNRTGSDQMSGDAAAGSVANNVDAEELGATAPRLALPLPEWLTQLRLDPGVVGYAFLISILAFSAAYRFAFTYRDTSERWNMRASITHPLLRGVFTTPSRARVMQELLDKLQALVAADDYLLAHQELPMIHFLTRTRPYLYCAWPNFFSPGVFREVLARAQKERPRLPVCVFNRVNTSHPRWPDETYPPITSRRYVENQRSVTAFLDAQHYQKCWQNEAFEIWVPPSSGDKVAGLSSAEARRGQ